MDDKPLVNRLEQDIEAMESSASPVAKALAGFLRELVAFKGYEVLAEQYTLPDFRHLYKGGISSSRLQAISGKAGLNSVYVVLTREQKYYLLYFPRGKGEKGCAEFYKEVYVTDSSRYGIDDRLICLEVDVTLAEVAARPVAIINDSHEPMTGGLISCMLYKPTKLEEFSQLVDEMCHGLQGRYIQVEGETLSRKPPQDIPTF